jgi:uncharacterized membrane protein (UPF0127 family)
MTALSRFVVAFALALTLGFAFAPKAGADDARPPQEQAEVESLTFITASGPHKFLVEVMRTDAQRERGLMFRRSLAADHGMLFAFATEEPVMMWMKNTYIPLDMIFMNKAGAVVSIIANTTPLSEHILSSGGPVFAVVEVNAGTAAKIGLKVGDKVQNALFGN